jgi:hypothetical protein
VRYTALDAAAIAVVAIAAAVQFLRARDSLSQVLYESLGLVGAAYGANRLHVWVQSQSHLSAAVSFLLCFVVLGVVALVVAVLLNARLGFGMGPFNYVLGLLFAVVSAYAVGHATMRVFELGFVVGNPAMREAMARSWVARELIRFRTLVEVLAILRFARSSNI